MGGNQGELNNKLDIMNDTVDSLEGDVFDLQQENSRMKAQLDQCQRREEEMQTRIKEAMFNAKLAEERSERNEQYSRRNNIKLLFMAESANAFESAEESERKALKLFHDKLGLRHIKSEHIEAAHRVGKKNAGKIRPIIVKFVSRKIKQEVIKNRRKLKNSDPKVVIVEDLTKHVYTLFLQASDHPGAMRTWTAEGKVFLQDIDSKTHRIKSLSDLRHISSALTTSPTPQLPQQQQPGNDASTASEGDVTLDVATASEGDVTLDVATAHGGGIYLPIHCLPITVHVKWIRIRLVTRQAKGRIEQTTDLGVACSRAGATG